MRATPRSLVLVSIRDALCGVPTPVGEAVHLPGAVVALATCLGEFGDQVTIKRHDGFCRVAGRD